MWSVGHLWPFLFRNLKYSSSPKELPGKSRRRFKIETGIFRNLIKKFCRLLKIFEKIGLTEIFLLWRQKKFAEFFFAIFCSKYIFGELNKVSEQFFLHIFVFLFLITN